MGISAWNKKMVWGHFISDIIDSDVLKILLWTREVFSAYVLVWKTKTFSYTWADQVFEVPEDCNMTIECWGAWSNNASWWYAKWVVPVTKWQKLSFMIWWNWGRSNDWTTYWFGWSTTYWGRWGWWLSWVFTWDTAIGANDASRVLVIAWWAWGGRTWGWAWGWETWQNWNGGSYWYPWAWGTQTWRWNWGNTRSEQFRWGGWSWTYWFGWGGWWRWWNGSWWDGSWDDDAQAGWGSGYVLSSATDRVLTQWGWSAAGQDWSVKIRYLVKERPQPTPKARLPHEYQEVEYIESTGTQWIDSWYIPKWTSWFEMKFRNISAINTYRTLIWTRTDTSTAAFWIWWMNSKCYMEMSPANIEYTRSDGWFNTGIDYEMSFLNKTLICNWETFQSWTNFTQDSARNLYIFSWNSNWQTQPFEAAASRMYYLKLYEWENLVRDFVPCYRVSDWVAWLYDLVEWKFYTNSWTWTFIKWAPVNVWQMPSWYTELAYIQSTGTQYIDTWIIWENKYIINTKFMFSDLWWTSEDLAVIASTWTSRPSYVSYIKKRWASWHYWSQMVWSDYSTATWSSPSIATNTEYTVEAKLSTSWNYLTVNWTKNTWSYSSDYNTWYSMYMFASNNGGTVWNQMKWKIFYLKIYDLSNNLIRDYVPCVRDSDGVIWMYDLVTKQFFANAWTWNFVAGPVVFRNGFVPSYRTVWYFPLVDNVDDVANWLSLTTSWTKEDLWRTFTATTTFSNRENTKPTKFVSVFLKINSWLNGTGCCTQLFDLWETPCCYVTSHSDSSLRNTVHYSNWSSTWPHAWTGIVQWQWFHLCYWYYGWTINMRVNGVKTTIWSGCTWTNWWNDFIRINGDSLNITCSDYIMEKEWWTDGQVADYLNAKKALYWIS